MRLERAKFKATDLYDIELASHAREEIVGTKVVQYAEYAEQQPHWFTLKDREKIVLIYGLFEEWPGVATAHAIPSVHINDYGLAATRDVWQILKLADEIGSYRRIEAYVDCGFTEGERWAEVVGFEKESRMAKRSPSGGDQWMYVRLGKEE